MKIIQKCFVCLILIQVHFFNCQRNDSKDLITIDVESNINNFEYLFLSKFTDNIHYVPLERYEDLFFSGIWECVISDSLILAKDISKCLLYDYDGNFITKIGEKGRGPGEYNYISNVIIAGDNKIYIQSLNDLIIYDINGEYIRKCKNYFLFNQDYIYSWNLLNDSLIFGHIPNSTGKKKYKAIILNQEGNTLKLYDNNILFNRVKELFSPQEGHANIYSFNGKYFYKEIYNDTLFYLDNNYQLIPSIAFEFGKYSEPVSHRENKTLEKDLGYTKEWSSYLYLENVYQNNKYLLLDCQYKGHFPVKRKTPRIVSGVKSDYNTTNVLGIYNKLSGELVFCKPLSTDNPLLSSGIFNDIDAGPSFFPMNMVNDSTMVMWMDAKQLKDHVASDDFKNTTPKSYEKKKELENLANNLSEFDNPVLMIVIFNKNE